MGVAGTSLCHSTPLYPPSWTWAKGQQLLLGPRAVRSRSSLCHMGRQCGTEALESQDHQRAALSQADLLWGMCVCLYV